MNATKRETRDLSKVDFDALREVADRAIRKFMPGMPADQREDHAQAAIAEAWEALPGSALDELKTEVARRAADIASNETRREKRREAIRERDPSLAPASGGALLEGEALRQAVQDRAWHELRQHCPGLTRETLDRVLAYGSEFEGTADDDDRELDAFELHWDLARALAAAVAFVHNLNLDSPEEGHPQIERLVRVVGELCGDVRFSDVVKRPIDHTFAEYSRGPGGEVRPTCDNATARELLTYRPAEDLDLPSPGLGTDVRRGAVHRWIFAECRGEVPPLRTNRQFANVTLLAGAWPSVDGEATVDEVLDAEIEDVKKLRQRADLTSKRLQEIDRLEKEFSEAFESPDEPET